MPRGQFGDLGTPGRGYETGLLSFAIRAALNLDTTKPTLWLGASSITDWPSILSALQSVSCALVGVFDDEAKPTTDGAWLSSH